jgi:hypothetical protein
MDGHVRSKHYTFPHKAKLNLVNKSLMKDTNIKLHKICSDMLQLFLCIKINRACEMFGSQTVKNVGVIIQFSIRNVLLPSRGPMNSKQKRASMPTVCVHMCIINIISIIDEITRLAKFVTKLFNFSTIKYLYLTSLLPAMIDWVPTHITVASETFCS